MGANGLGLVHFEEDSSAKPQYARRPERRPTLEKVMSPSIPELDAMSIGRGSVYTGPQTPQSAVTRHSSQASVATSDWRAPADWDIQTSPSPRTPNQLESSRRSSADAAAAVQSWKSPSINKKRVLASCFVYFANGANDSCTGALLPYIENYYNVDYSIVSIVFITNAIGFITAAFFVHALDAKLGRAKTLMLCEMVTALGYILLLIPPPYAVFAVGYFLTGLGIATSLALNNVFNANLSPATIVLGICHGSYGIGGTVGPIVATSMVTKGILFSRFFAILLALRILNIFGCGWTFRHLERDTQTPSGGDIALHSGAERAASHANSQQPQAPSKRRDFLNAVKARTTIVGALFIFAYQGAEVSISGWIISFLITFRGGDPSHVGYVSAGFWLGITLGRFFLTPFAHRLGEKVSTYALIAASTAFEIIVWQVPSVIGDAVFVALIGLVLGPVYPCAMSVFSKLLPRSLQNTALAFVSSAGSSGGAVAPFITGILAQAYGTWVLHPVAIGMYVVMGMGWSALPRVAKPRD